MSRTDMVSSVLATAETLISASSSSFSSRCQYRVRSRVRSHAQPGVVAQLPDLGRRHEAGPQHAPLGQLGQPDSVQLVGLRPARRVLDVAGVDQLHVQAGRLQQVEPDPPVVRRRFQGDLLDPLARQVLAEFQDRVRGGVHVPHPGPPLPGPGTDAAPGCTPSPTPWPHRSRDPLQDLLVLLVLDLLRFPHRTISSPQQQVSSGMPGGLGREAEI